MEEIVKQQKLKWFSFVIVLGAIMVLGACKKKVAPPPPPPPPPVSGPTASLTADPNTVDKGQSVTLTWQTTNATDVSIDGIGAVQANGSQQVTPSDSTTYRLTAKGLDLYPVPLAMLTWGQQWLAPSDGEPHLTHQPCGTTLRAVLSCDQCGDLGGLRHAP